MEVTRMFIERIARNCQIEPDKGEELCICVFRGLAQRLGYSAGVQFVIQLPYGFQKRLLTSPVAPDRSVTAQRMVSEVADLLVVPTEGARHYIQEVWNLLTEFADSAQLERTLDHLPAEILQLFVRSGSPVKHDFEQWISC